MTDCFICNVKPIWECRIPSCRRRICRECLQRYREAPNPDDIAGWTTIAQAAGIAYKRGLGYPMMPCPNCKNKTEPWKVL